MPPFWRRIEGRFGNIVIPDLGIDRVGVIASWVLTRRADEGPEAEFYDAHIVLDLIIPTLFNDPDYRKEVLVQAVRRGPLYRLEPQEGNGQSTVLAGSTLVMKRVKLCRVE